MKHRATFAILLLATILTPGASPVRAEGAQRTISFGVIGMAGGAVEALQAYQDELKVSVRQIRPASFKADPLPDLSGFDVVITSFASGDLKDRYKAALAAARAKNPALKVFCVGPGPICGAWAEWAEPGTITTDPKMAAFYGLSRESMRNMLVYTLVTYFGREGRIEEQKPEKLVHIHHPRYGDGFDSVKAFLDRAKKDGRDIEHLPRVAVGSWRHHVLFHQPKVIDAIIEELEGRGMLAVCLVADDPGFTARMREFKPDAVVMTSHTQEPASFWEELNVPRFHALWFTGESMDQWRASDNPGMQKSAIFHQVASAEVKGATECLTAGGTESGGDGGEEILPIPDRIRRIGGRVQAWIDLARTKNADKRIALITYDREADKAGLMSGPAHNLNAPKSMVKFLEAMKQAGYGLANLPPDDTDLLHRLADHGRQMGAWEPASLAKTAVSGEAALVEAETYARWFEEMVPQRRRDEVVKQWGQPPGDIMVWRNGGKKYLVLPKLNLGNAVLMTQPLKGETITASMKVQDPDESLLPPTHHFLATYFWLQQEFKPHAIVHFGTHGQEWLFPGKQVALSRYDWSDMMLGDLPNINPWLSSNTAELLPCKRRAQAVTVDFMPPPLMGAGLSDELLNLESTVNKYKTLDDGVLKRKFARGITDQAATLHLDRDLKLKPGPAGLLDDAAIAAIAAYLHDLSNEQVPASMHILGEPPLDDLRIPYLVASMGKGFLKNAGPVFAKGGPTPADNVLAARGAEVLTLMLRRGLSMDDAVKACGGVVGAGGLPPKLVQSLQLAADMDAALNESPREISGILDALAGKFIAPGPSGNPERNPAVLPTGRNMYVMNPEELPSRASWELGSRLIRDYLEQQRGATGRYPRKIAFSLVPFASYSDFGITESQVLYLMGLRPLWDAKNRVREVEVIPAAELKRPRIDVFLSARSIYRDELPHMMKLLDQAIRMVAGLKEKDNYVYENSQAMLKTLTGQGLPADRALALSTARMFGARPEEIIDGHNWFFYLTERSGEWENRDDLLDVYLKHSRYVYTEGAWGENAPEAFDFALRDTEMILRSWYDNRDFVLSNKFTWWVDGTLSLAIKHLTGREIPYLFVDVRDTDEASIVDSTAVVDRDFRARVTNPRWIAAMMKEGYAGGNIMAKNIDNLMGWEIMREESVDDSQWNELVDTYVRDVKKLGLSQWFDTTNPHAFQKLSVTMLETARKGFWQADEKTRLEIAAAYAKSVVKHGPVSGPREGGNKALESYMETTLKAPSDPAMDALLAQYQAAMASLAQASDTAGTNQEPIAGKKLLKKEVENPPASFIKDHGALLLVMGAGLLIMLLGFLARGRNTAGRG